MTTLAIDDVLGRIWDSDPMVFRPGATTGRKPGHAALIRYVARSGDPNYKFGQPTQAGFAFGLICTEGLAEQWRVRDDVQRQYRSPEEFIGSFSRMLRESVSNPAALRRYARQAGIGHNERVDNGAKLIEKLVWGVATPDHASNGVPAMMALGTTGFTTAAHGDLSIQSATHYVTTNEYTNDGLTRTAVLTPTQADPSALDGQYIITIANTFTDSTAGNTVNGGALFDLQAATNSNLFMEYVFASAVILVVSDTVAVTATLKG